jgi:HD-GYP domain-containing protein (c-di-GMP phosphodiesterase class II)
MSPAAAISEVRRCAGTQCDPNLVTVFLDVLARSEASQR